MLKKIPLFLVSIVLSIIVIACAEDISTLQPLTPYDNDRLIAKYKSSKDISYIQRMIDTYTGIDEGMLKDARRLAYLLPYKSPHPGMHKTISTAICEKYDCKSKSERSKQVMTIASGMWAIDSLSGHDSQVKDMMNSFLNNYPHIKKIYMQEQERFGNYQLLAVVYVAKPEKLGPLLTSYEALGPFEGETIIKALDMKKANP